MRRTLVALLALLPAASAVAPSAPAAAPKSPTAAVVFRPECFGYVEEEAQLGSASGGYGGVAVGTTTSGSATGKRGGRAAPAAAPPPPPPVQAQAPSPSPAESYDASANAPSKRKSPAQPTTKPAKPSNAGASNELAKFEAPADKKAAEKSDKAPKAAAKETTADAGAREDRAKDLDDAYGYGDVATEAEPAEAPADEANVERVQRPVAPVLDWGATVYLSNDDSMSLASAQRLLYAAMNHLPFSVSQIRPHELLNYFSFDAVAPTVDQTFDVLASAEQQGDKLSVALAVKGASPPRQSLDLTLVVDRSCSMESEGRMDYTKRGLNLMSDQLTQGDRIDVVLFDDQVCVPLENYVVGRDDPSLLQRTIDGMAPKGSTDVGLGLRTAYNVAKSHTDSHGRNRRVMILTDALMNTGDVDPNTVSDIGKAYEDDGIRLTGVGVGSEFNDQVLDMLTEKGKGAYVFLGSTAVVDRLFGPTGFDQLVQTIAHDVQFSLVLPKSLAMERFYGEEISTVQEDIQPINYASGTTQLFLQDLVLKDGKVVKTDPVELKIAYRNAVTGEPETRTFRTTVGAMVGADPHNVRKGLALMAWTDFLTEQAMGGDPCGRPLAAYATRAAKIPEDAEIAFVNGLVTDTCGAFDLPRVVSDAGVPFKVKVDADIPISTVALACGGVNSTERLSGADVIAMFTAPPGVCELTLSGTVDMTAQVEVPSTGGALRCVVRGGRVSCS